MTPELCKICNHRRSEHWFGKDCRAFEGCRCNKFITEIPEEVIKLIERELELIWYENHVNIQNTFTFGLLGSQLAVFYDHPQALKGIPIKFEYLNPSLEQALTVLGLMKVV